MKWMRMGWPHKAQRGEQGMRMPMGGACATVNGVLQYLVEHGLNLPAR